MTKEKDAGKQSMHVTVDPLRNPCFDYIQNVVFSPPGATFSAGEVAYTDFDSVHFAFLVGDILEEQLKLGIVSERNRLLTPLRANFSTDEQATELLDKVCQFKNEVIPTEKKIRKLDLVVLGKAAAGSYVVFAPYRPQHLLYKKLSMSLFSYAVPSRAHAKFCFCRMVGSGDEFLRRQRQGHCCVLHCFACIACRVGSKVNVDCQGYPPE